MATNTDTTQTDADQTSNTLTAGEQVLDREVDDPDPMRVLTPNVGVANQVCVGEQTVADFESNSDYPNNSAVACVVYEDNLDRLVPEWEEMVDSETEFVDELNDYENQWGVVVQRYNFPTQRLIPASGEAAQTQTDTAGGEMGGVEQ